MAIRHIEHEGETIFEFNQAEAHQLIGAQILSLGGATSLDDIMDAKLVAQSAEDIIQVQDWLRELHIKIVSVQ